MIALFWLGKTDSKLIDIVKHEYSSDFKQGTSLYKLMPGIAKSIDSLLKRHSDDYIVSRIDEILPERTGDDINRFRGVNKSKNKKKNDTSTLTQRNLVCSHCASLKKLLKIPEMDVNHRFEICPRKSSSVRLCVNDDDIPEGDTLSNKNISPFDGF